MAGGGGGGGYPARLSWGGDGLMGSQKHKACKNCQYAGGFHRSTPLHFSHHFNFGVGRGMEPSGGWGGGAVVELGKKLFTVSSSILLPPPPPPFFFSFFFYCLCVFSVLGVSVVADEDISR